MDERVKKIKTVKGCYNFIENATRLGGTELVKQAYLRATEIQIEEHNATSTAEKEALQAVFAYEQTLRVKHGKSIKASRTWQMIKKLGIIEAVNKAVNRPNETLGYTALMEMGLAEFAFEAVILRHSDTFSTEAVEISKKRLADWT